MITHSDPAAYGGIYTNKKYDNLIHKFDHSSEVNTNYSQSYQDMFVLTMLNGKKNGTYVEIGANDAIIMSNTYLLESQFSWKGISVDILEESKKSYEGKNRKNDLILSDALILDYTTLFEKYNLPKQIDYLQLDIDPKIQTLRCLKLLPLDKYRFSVITYETDFYAHERVEALLIREESRKILLSYGYEMIAGNISNVGNDPYEDWYIDPNVIDRSIIDKFKNSPEYNDRAETLLIKL